MKTKNKLVDRTIAIKEEAKNVMFWSNQDIDEKNIPAMNFAECLRTSENGKVHWSISMKWTS